MIAKHGEAAARDWLAGLKRNARIYQDEEAVVAAVNRGEVTSGMINSYYWYRLQLELGKGAMHSALYYFSSNDVGAVVNISGAACSSRAGAEEAERFISFLVSEDGQKIIAGSDDFEYPSARRHAQRVAPAARRYRPHLTRRRLARQR